MSYGGRNRIASYPYVLVTAGTTDMRREGQAGGFKELDEQEVEEARRRRKEYEEKDQ